ncbi:MAG: hypothetical protein VX589_08505, partial [Myxococcota bacterium]|nr:hypothetical protein [Myxococcota bacterium]
MKTNRLRNMAALSLLFVFYGCDSSTGSGAEPGDMGGAEESGGNEGDSTTGGRASDAGGTSTEPSGQRCLGEDTECPDNEYCEKDPDENFGQCLPGCRQGVDDPSGMGRTCDPETREWVEKPCEGDSDCPEGEFCDDSADPNECKAGCRSGETQGEQACNPSTREFEAKAACCKGGGDQCTSEFSSDCSGDNDVFTPDATCEANPCAPSTCENDDNCADNEYCDSNEMLCKPGCRLGEGGCEDELTCNPETRACTMPECSTDEDCEENTVCDAPSRICVAACTAESCGAGQRCNAQTRRCVEECEVDGDDCDAGETCDADSRICQCTVEPDSCGMERTCNADTLRCEDDEPAPCDPADPNACANPRQVCVAATGQCEFVQCQEDADCEEGQRCVIENGNESVCMLATNDECQEQQDCGAGRVCLPARGMDGRRCADDCMTGMCEEGEVCNPNTGICDPRCRSGE